MKRRRLLLSIVVVVSTARMALAAPGDVPLERTGPETPESIPVGVFPHWVHRIRFTCNVCHPSLFPMKAGETAVTMEGISEGKQCGACHNGRIAWGVYMDTCSRCHRSQP